MDAKTVCIWVCGKDDVRIHFFCKFQSKCPGIFILRVRIWNGREVSIRNFLLFHNINLGKAKFTEYSSNRDVSGSVKWCVNDLHIFRSLRDDLRVDALFFQLRDVFVVKISSDDAEQILCSGFIFFHCFYHGEIRYFCHFRQDVFVMRRCDLGTVLPVYFVAVVLSRVVAGCDHDAGDAAKFPHCKGKLRCGAQGLKKIGMDAVCIQAESCLSCKLRGHDTGIVGNGNSFVLAFHSNDIVGKSLCGLTYRIDIHAVGSSSDHSTESASSKLQLTVEAVLDLFLVARKVFQFLLGLCIKIRVCTPFFVGFLITHLFISSLKFILQ